MNKRQTRLFAIISTALAATAFIGMTIDSHRQFGKLTNADQITEQVKRGQDVWHENNCINCHTLFGEGAYYAPDLTKITQHRGEAYLQAYMRDPSKFYDETRHRRLMPKQNISDSDITSLIAFLDWVSKVDNAGWPPRPILVTGSAMPALGEKVFRTAAPACVACHSVAPGVNMAGPSLAGLVGRTEKLIGSVDYKGQAKDLAGYIHESIASPSAHLVAGAMYSANGTSFMPPTYAKDLSPEQIDHLVAYLSSLK